MHNLAKGNFTVESMPSGEPEKVAGAMLGRMRLVKRFTGDFVGTGNVDMLTAMSDVKGSAGYVAIEHLSGTLQGRNGTFVCQHAGRMDRGRPELSIRIVPDTGTGELAGIEGVMRIDIVDGEHRYELEYGLGA